MRVFILFCFMTLPTTLLASESLRVKETPWIPALKPSALTVTKNGSSYVWKKEEKGKPIRTGEISVADYQRIEHKLMKVIFKQQARKIDTKSCPKTFEVELLSLKESLQVCTGDTAPVFELRKILSTLQ